MPGERDNARNNARCTQARMTTHGLDGQHQYVDGNPRGRVKQRTEINGESMSMMWLTLGSRMAKAQNGTEPDLIIHQHLIAAGLINRLSDTVGQ